MLSCTRLPRVVFVFNAAALIGALAAPAYAAAVTADSTGNGSAGSTDNFANYNLGADWNGQEGNVTTVGTNGKKTSGPVSCRGMWGLLYSWCS